MKKISKLILVIAALCMVVTAFAVVASAEEATASISADAYFGEYESGDLSGAANIIFGQVNADATEYGIVVKDAEGNKKVFKGLAKGAEGKFGVALYTMPDGYYEVNVYSGAPTVEEGGVLSSTMAIYANKGKQVVADIKWHDTTLSHGSQWTVATYEGGTYTEPDWDKVTGTPANAEFVGWFVDGEEYDWSTPAVDGIAIDAIWESDGYTENNVFTYTKTSETGGRTTIISSVGSDLSKGGSVTMEMDVLDTLEDTNYNWYFYAFAWKPSASSISSGYSGTGYIGYGFNGAYTPSDPTYDDGWVGISPPSGATQTFTNGTTNLGNANLFKAGNTVRIVYTAPTADAEGSIVFYAKPTGAPDTDYVEMNYLRGIDTTDVFPQGDVYIGLDIYPSMSWANPNMKWENMKIYNSKGQALPVEFGGKADVSITAAPQYVADTAKVYEIAFPSMPDSSTGIAGQLANKEAVALPYNGTLTLEMDILESNIDGKNANIGLWFWYSKIATDNTNTYFGGFGDNAWFGNPAYTGEDLGLSIWKTEDTSSAGTPSDISDLILQDIFATGNSVKIVYTAPSATVNGSIQIFVKYIEEDDSAYYEAAWVYEIEPAMMYASQGASSVYMALGSLNNQPNTDVKFTVTGLRMYTAAKDIELVAYQSLTLTEVDA